MRALLGPIALVAAAVVLLGRPTAHGESPGGASAAAAVITPGWSGAASMATARSNFTATRLADGRVLAVGGLGNGTGGVYLASAEVYDPSTNAWTPAASMPQARAVHTATLLSDGRVLVAGGRTNSRRTRAPCSTTPAATPGPRRATWPPPDSGRRRRCWPAARFSSSAAAPRTTACSAQPRPTTPRPTAGPPPAR